MTDSEVERFDELDVEGFSPCDGKGATRHFERDHDLEVRVARRRLAPGISALCS